MRRLRQDGIDDGRVTCPLGLSAAGGVTCERSCGKARLPRK